MWVNENLSIINEIVQLLIQFKLRNIICGIVDNTYIIKNILLKKGFFKFLN